MRVLLTSHPVWSHLVPMVVPVAQALQAAGHQVAVATGTTLGPDLDRCGLPHLPMPRMLAPSQMGSDPDYARRIGFSVDGLLLPDIDAMPRGAGFGRLFAGLSAVRAAQDMLATDFRPDLVIRECTEFGGYLLAEQLGLPCVTLDAASQAPTRHSRMLPWLNGSRVTLGLAPVDDTSTVAGNMWVSWLPETWYRTQERSPAHRYHRGPDEPAQALDPAVAGLPAELPLVLATLGSNIRSVPEDQRPFRLIIDALGALPCTAVVALGRDTDPADWDGPRPDNVHLVSFAQQRLTLPACDLFVTHAGFGAVREALTAGVPTVAVPLNADQPANAQRMAELGVGVTISPRQATTPTLAAACQQVLDNPAYRHTARGFQRRILGLPGMDTLINELTTLITKHRQRQAAR